MSLSALTRTSQTNLFASLARSAPGVTNVLHVSWWLLLNWLLCPSAGSFYSEKEEEGKENKRIHCLHWPVSLLQVNRMYTGRWALGSDQWTLRSELGTLDIRFSLSLSGGRKLFFLCP